MDLESKMMKESELEIKIDQMRLSALQSEVVALSSIVHLERSSAYRSDLIQAIKENLIEQHKIAAAWGKSKFEYQLGKVL